MPEQYDLRKALADLEEDVWLARQRADDIAPGQKVFFWLARKGGGLIATGQVLSLAEDQPAPSWQLPYWTAAAMPAAGLVEPRVRVRYQSKFATSPLTRDFLKLDPVLAKQRPIGPVHVGTNFGLSASALSAIEARLAGR
ncbi:hypothetical protein [Falsiroseomonas sp.]|uniref:hypothetical protein n=1 Tax=Falsiroseomonas sp. TaxID=2870721 RepID=UPI003F706DC3